MEYLVAFQLLCGCFAGYVAAQKHRNWFWWFLVGTLVPVAGVLIALAVDRPDANRGHGNRGGTRNKEGQKLQRPKRCCGDYIPDCHGCPYFSRPLFSGSDEGEKKGYCKFFKKELIEKKPEEGRVIIRGKD